jgi:hypothetical protein
MSKHRSDSHVPALVGGRSVSVDPGQAACDGSFITAELLRELRQRGALSTAQGERRFLIRRPRLVGVGVELPLLFHGVCLGRLGFCRGARGGHQVGRVRADFEAPELPADGLLAATEFLGQLFWGFASTVVVLKVVDGLRGPSLPVPGRFDGCGRSGRGSVRAGGLWDGGHGGGGDEAADLTQVTDVEFSGEFALDRAVGRADEDGDLQTTVFEEIRREAVPTVRAADFQLHCGPVRAGIRRSGGELSGAWRLVPVGGGQQFVYVPGGLEATAAVEVVTGLACFQAACGIQDLKSLAVEEAGVLSGGGRREGEGAVSGLGVEDVSVWVSVPGTVGVTEGVDQHDHEYLVWTSGSGMSVAEFDELEVSDGHGGLALVRSEALEEAGSADRVAKDAAQFVFGGVSMAGREEFCRMLREQLGARKRSRLSLEEPRAR